MSDNNEEACHFVSIVGRYTMLGDVELKGDSQGLYELAATIKSVSLLTTLKLSIPKLASPAPYEAFLTAIEISITDIPVDIQWMETKLRIAGAKPFMETFADNIEFLAINANEHNRHIHLEYFPGLDYMHPRSVPLVVSVLIE